MVDKLFKKNKVGLKIRGHVKIINDSTGEILLDQDNAIHVQNMARIIARGLANEDNSTIFRLALGDGGTFVDVGGNIVFNLLNDGNNGGSWESRLYHEVYSEIVDELDAEFLTDPGSAGSDNVRVGGGHYLDFDGDHGGDPSGAGVASSESGKKSSIVITAYINENEPLGVSPFVFDELGLYSPGAVAVNNSGVSSINVGNKLSTDDVDPPLTPLTLYGISVDVDGSNKTEIIETPASGSGTAGAFTYGDILQGINDSTWYDSGEDLSNFALLFITDLTPAEYPSITGQISFGFVNVQSKSTGKESTIVLKGDPLLTSISGNPNLIYVLGNSDWDNVDVNISSGENAGDQNNTITTENERERLLSHLIFTPLEKVHGELLKIYYYISMGIAGENLSNITEVGPMIPSLTPTNTATVTSTSTPTPTVTQTATPSVTPSATNLEAVTFDGSTRLELAGGFGATSKVITFAVWVKPAGTTGIQVIWSDSSGRHVQLNDTTLHIQMNNPAVVLGTLTGVFIGKIGVWVHVAVSLDVTDTNKRHVFIDGVDQTGSVAWTTYTDSNMIFNLNQYMGRSAIDTSPLVGCVSQFYVTKDYVDLSLQSNMDKLYFGGAIDYAANDLTGSAPDIFLNGNETTFITNGGSGGDFTVIDGALLPCTGPLIQPTPSPTVMLTMTPTPTVTPTISDTPAATPANTVTPTITNTPAATPANTVTPTITNTPTQTSPVWPPWGGDNNGTPNTSFAIPADAQGCCFDGTNLIIGRNTSFLGAVYVMDGISASVLSSFSITGFSSANTLAGVTYDGTDLWILDSDGDIWHMSGKTSSVLSSFSFPLSINEVATIGFDGINLIIADPFQDKVFKMAGKTSTITDSFSTSGLGTLVLGITYDGADIILGEVQGAAPDSINVMTGFSSTVNNSFATAHELFGITYVGTNLVSIDGVADLAYVHDGISVYVP